MTRRLGVARFMILVGALVAGCGEAPSPPAPAVPSSASTTSAASTAPARLHRFAAQLMGTPWTITVADPREPGALTSAVNAAFAEVERVERQMSEWRPESAISAINLAAGKAPVQVPLEVIAVVRRALQVAAQTDGAFDPTWAALRGVWDFKRDPPQLPRKSTLQAAVARIDHRKVQVQGNTVFLPEAGMALGLGGIAKGYGIDRAVAVLRARGLTRFIVDGGGDLYIAGEKAPGVPWTIGLRHPRGGPLLGEVPVRDAAVVTSGDYERFFELGGRRYHHILDVRTGLPARQSVAVSLIAPDATTADAWATGLFVLGPAGLDRLPAGISAAVFTADGRSHARGALMHVGPRWR